MSFLRDLLDKNNATSTMRFILLFAIVFVVLDVFGVWTYVSVCKTTLQAIDATVVSLVSALVAILITGKVLEKREEAKPDPKSTQ
ncbi:MAG: hypothetical protein PHY46_05315 [Candidatus Omnitrophica bacterium]|nr:hypothetical protein [Candidatus Omnitrophota bacterium]